MPAALISRYPPPTGALPKLNVNVAILEPAGMVTLLGSPGTAANGAVRAMTLSRSIGAAMTMVIASIVCAECCVSKTVNAVNTGLGEHAIVTTLDESVRAYT